MLLKPMLDFTFRALSDPNNVAHRQPWFFALSTHRQSPVLCMQFSLLPAIKRFHSLSIVPGSVSWTQCFAFGLPLDAWWRLKNDNNKGFLP